MLKNNSSAFLIWSACLGNFFEHYDTALFGFLSPFLAPLIFPNQDPITALLLTYAMIPLGMIARPFGAIVFGYIGDVYGRKKALVLSLLGMSFISACISLTPTYEQVGLFSPIIFCVGRIGQNFFAAGETMGGAIYLLENSTEKRHDLISSLFGASTIGGILLASAAIAYICHIDAIELGWRLLYLLGSITGIFGFILRKLKMNNESIKSKKVNLSETLFEHLKNLKNSQGLLLKIILISGFFYANYSMALVLTNGFIPLISTFTKTDMIGLNTFLLVLDFCFLPIFGWLATKISREKIMLAASLTVVFTSIPLCIVLQEANFLTVVIIRICFVLFGVAFCAPFHAWTQQLVPPSQRYTIISFGYAIGSQALGGPTAALSLWAFKTTSIISSIAWYWILLGTTSSFILIKAIRDRDAMSGKSVFLKPSILNTQNSGY